MARYVNPIYATGYKRQLQKTDVFKITSHHDATFLGPQLSKIWEAEKKKKKRKKKKPSFFRSMQKFVFYGMLRSIFGILVTEIFKIMQPVFLKKLLDALTSDNFGQNNDAYYWGGALIGAMLLSWFVYHPAVLINELLGVKAKTGAMSLIYEKMLKIRESKLGAVTSGHLITMFASDAHKLQEGLKLTPYLVIGPIFCTIAVILLWLELGPSCLAGLGVLLLFIPLQSWFGKLFARYRRKALGKTDERINTMNEIISSMQVTKMYTWEDSFAKKIQLKRKEETRRIMKSAMMKALNNAITFTSAFLTLFATFSIYYFYGGNITLSKVYFAMSIFFIIRLPVVVFFPLAVQMGTEFYVSCKRIQTFLLNEEIETKDNDEQTDIKLPSLQFINVTASWESESMIPVIQNLSFTADEKNPLIIIHGPVGCGKTSILLAALEEIQIKSGSVHLKGTKAYVAQCSWIFAGTIRENILFGRPYDEEYFYKVSEACALLPDFDLFSKRENTLVGERGVSLSGGQKARISLARAVYRDADIYLLDDPLSAVDTKVGKHIFERCINGILKNKIKILVTHQTQYLSHATETILLKDYKNINEIDVNKSEEKKQENSKNDKNDDSDSAIDLNDDTDSSKSEDLSKDVAKVKKNEEEIERVEPKDEFRKKGRVSFKTYLNYFIGGIGLISSAVLYMLIILTQILLTFTDYWLGEWANGENERHLNNTFDAKFLFTDNPDYNIYLFAGLVVMVVILSFLSSSFFFAAMINCSRKLHNRMFAAVLKAPMFFFDTNPVGQVLNRFSGDIHLMDDELPWVFNDFVRLSLVLLSAIIVNCISVPYLLIVVFILSVMFFFFRNYFMATSRELKRLEAVDRSPLFTHVSATIEGVVTIRSFSMNKVVNKEFISCLNYQAESKLLFIMCSRWFAQRLDLGVILFSAICLFAPIILAEHASFDPGLIGVSLTYLLTLGGMFQWTVRQSAEVDNMMTSVERVMEYTKLESEKESSKINDLPNNWIKEGTISADNVSYAYHDTLPNVLTQLNFNIAPNEKIGIVGRTGAGKSSLISMFFRLGKNGGVLKIDEHDTANIELKKLRRTISVIPQDPVLFGGPLRKNLDPFDEYTDEQIWNSLEEVQMKNTVQSFNKKLLAEITESGSNLSVGERQLLCLSRALLKNNKVLLVDEATANVDLRTDELIQTTIRERFKNCTVLTIAHRLNTVMDSDRIMVIHEGKIVEFDAPSCLLQTKDGFFKKLVEQTGVEESKRLEYLASKSWN